MCLLVKWLGQFCEKVAIAKLTRGTGLAFSEVQVGFCDLSPEIWTTSQTADVEKLPDWEIGCGGRI